MDGAGRPQAEAEPLAHEERLRLALAAAGAATWDWNIETGEIVRSEGMAALFGLPAGALDGTLDEHFVRVHPDDRGLIAEMDRLHLTEGVPYDVEYRVVRPDGGVRWLREKAEAVRDADGRAIRLLGVTMDVTDRKEVEEALRRSEARFRSLVRNAPDLITILAVDGTVAYESPAIARILGYAPDELVGANALALVHPDDLARVGDLFAECLAKPGVNIPVAFRFRHQDGSWRDLEAVGTNLLADPAVGGIVVNSRDVTERRQVETALREAEARYRTLVEQIPAITYVQRADETGALLYISPQVEAVLGYPPAELVAGNTLWTQRLHPDDYGRVMADDARTDATGEPFRSEYRLRTRDGRYAWFRDGAVLLRDGENRPLVWRGVMLDVTTQKETEAALREAEARYRTLVEQLPLVIYTSAPDENGTPTYVSPHVEAVLGFASAEWVANPQLWVERLHPDDRNRVLAEVARTDAVGEPFRLEYRKVARDGRVVWVRDEAVLVRDEAGRPRYWQGFNIDVTARKALETELAHLAYHDPLTGLPNRALFLERLEEALARARRGADPVAVLLLDLDGFKLVNDSRGHDAGNRLLTEVGRRLRCCLPPAATLARLGGDEFAVLLEGITEADETTRAAERLIGALRDPIVLDGDETYVDASVGVAVSARRRSRSADLLRSADIALYRAKAAGRGAFAVFAPRMQAPVTERLARETALRRALERDELRLLYQPKVALATGRIVGAEALVRWAHPERGVLPPSDFVGLAEETGLIVPLGRWALREACRQAAGWHDRRPDAPPLVCVNLSVRQLREADFAAEVARALAAAGLAPGRLQLEITETVAMADAPETQRALQALRKLGVRLAIDDFGTGYSSLGRLRDLAIDALKIDGSFVAGLGEDGASLAIVRAVAVLAHDLGLAVTAEGVETAEQVERLRKCGVEYGQGFRFAPPLASEAFGALLARDPCLPEDPGVPDGGRQVACDKPGTREAAPAVADGAGRGSETKLAVPAGR